MKVYNNHEDFLNDKNRTNGVTQKFLDIFYQGDLEECKEDNISNENCFD